MTSVNILLQPICTKQSTTHIVLHKLPLSQNNDNQDHISQDSLRIHLNLAISLYACLAKSCIFGKLSGIQMPQSSPQYHILLPFQLGYDQGRDVLEHHISQSHHSYSDICPVSHMVFVLPYIGICIFKHCSGAYPGFLTPSLDFPPHPPSSGSH